LQEKNTLVYYKHSYITDVKSFIILDHGSTEVEQSTHNPKIWVSNPPTGTVTVKLTVSEEMKENGEMEEEEGGTGHAHLLSDFHPQ
jgi:hypothetical protein